MISYIIICAIIIIICLVIYYIKKNNLIDNYAEYNIIKTLNISSIDDTCYGYITKVKNWNTDLFSDKEKKVLLTMRKLASTTYTDNTTSFPIAKDACVIPIEHLPVFNKIWDNKPWDLKNIIPVPGSDSYLRPTYANEEPTGYVYDFNNRTQSNFMNFLTNANLLYDSEYYDEFKKLTTELENLQKQKANLQNQYNYLTQQNTMYINLYNNMLAPNSDCKKNYNTMNNLSNQLYILSVNAGNMTMNLQNLQIALNANIAQINNLKTYYYTFTSNPTPIDMSYITNSNIKCIELATTSCDTNTQAWTRMNAIV